MSLFVSRLHSEVDPKTLKMTNFEDKEVFHKKNVCNLRSSGRVTTFLSFPIASNPSEIQIQNEWHEDDHKDTHKNLLERANSSRRMTADRDDTIVL